MRWRAGLTCSCAPGQPQEQAQRQRHRDSIGRQTKGVGQHLASPTKSGGHITPLALFILTPAHLIAALPGFIEAWQGLQRKPEHRVVPKLADSAPCAHLG